jgi:triosephosphate isomerase
MYFSHETTLRWTREVKDLCDNHEAITSGVVELFTLPTFVSIPAVMSALQPWPVGAQNLCSDDEGAFTGEVSGRVLAELGCKIVEIGHAERRKFFAETEVVVAEKVVAALRNNIDPLICVGEVQKTDISKTLAECVRQVKSALAYTRNIGHQNRIIIAYEPQWAIGASLPASDQHITDVCAGLRDYLSEKKIARGMVLYGGSAGPGLLTRVGRGLDGLFLGRFAHEPRNIGLILDEALLVSGY